MKQYLYITVCTFGLLCLSIGLWAQPGLVIQDGSPNTASHSGGYAHFGSSTTYVSIDNNEIQARAGASAGTLYLNYYGGDLNLLGNSNTTGDLVVDINGLVYDNSTNRVGIGTALPAYTLDVSGTGRFLSTAYFNASSIFTGIATFNGSYTNFNNGYLRLTNAGEVFNINLRSDGKVAFEANGTIGNNTLVIDDDSGYAGIGTDAPSEQLHVLGNIKCDGGLLFGTVEQLIDGGANTIESNADFDPNSHLIRDMGTSTTVDAWDNIYADAFVVASDMRLKEDVTPIGYGLDELRQLSTIKYKLMNDPQHDNKLGLSAQELLQLIPEAVITHNLEVDYDGNQELVELEHYGVTYNTLIPVLIKAIQELDQQVNGSTMKSDSNVSNEELLSLIKAQSREIEELKQKLQEQE